MTRFLVLLQRVRGPLIFVLRVLVLVAINVLGGLVTNLAQSIWAFHVFTVFLGIPALFI